MSQVLVTEQYLDDIADAIRSKNGSESTYTPAQMAGAIEDIHTADEVVLVQKTVNANGQYNASDDSADGYSGVRVNVPNTYSASDEGKVVSNGDLVAQTSKNIIANGTHDTTANNSVVVDVPNSYAAADEGKVVSGGALVGQTSRNIIENGTYDTTLNNEIVVNAHADPVLYKFINSAYYMDTADLICTISGRRFVKAFADPAFVTYIYTGSYTGAFLVSKTQNSAKYTVDTSSAPVNEITIDGEVWFVSAFNSFMSGNITSSDGYAQKLPGIYNTQESAAVALLEIAIESITQNGTYAIPSGYDGFDEFEVNIQPDLETKLITENGTYTPTEGKDGFSVVTVSVSGSGGSSNILSGADTPTASYGNDGDIYLYLYGLRQELVTQQSELNVIVTANTNWSGFEPWKAFTASSGWIGNGGNPHWLQIEFPEETSISEISFVSNDGSRSHAISRVEYSNDGVNYTDAVLIESTMTNNIGHVLFDGYYSARYFRLCFDGNYGTSTYPMVGKLELFGTPDNIHDAFCKVNGAWQSLIGTDIDDVNTGGGEQQDDPFALTEYIESSGTQYINTGYSVTDNTRLELVANASITQPTYATMFGVRDANNDNPSSYSCILAVAWASNLGNVNWGSSINRLTSYDKGNKTNYIISKTNYSADIDEIGLIANLTGSTESASIQSLFLFTLGVNGNDYGSVTHCNMKLYRFRIYESDVLVHEYLPFIDGNNVVCLHDTISGNNLYNIGAGVFTYGTDGE